MHQWQKFGENPSTDTGDIAETKLPLESRTDGGTDGRPENIASAGAYRRRRLKNIIWGYSNALDYLNIQLCTID